MSRISDFKQSSFDSYRKSDLVIIVDVYTKWCKPCKAMVPYLEEMQDNYKDYVKFLRLDAEEEVDFADEYGVEEYPTFLFFKDGKYETKLSGGGERTAKKIEDLIRNLSGMR